MSYLTARVSVCAIAIFLAMGPAYAAQLEVKGAWVRLPPPVVKTAAVYMVLQNHGDTDVAINSIASNTAENAAFHRITKQAGMMHMEPVNIVTVPAHGTVELIPGGMHVMLDGLMRRPKLGDVIHLVLRTSTGDELTVDAPVRASRPVEEPGKQIFLQGMALLKAHHVAKAAARFEQAAKLGNRRAQYQLGLLFARGEGVDRDLSRARELLRKAAMQGHPKAQFYLGQMFAFGDGGEKDNITATMWFWLATTLGDRYARDSLRVMTGKISSAELTEAKRRAKLLWQKMPHDMKIKRRMAMH